MCGAVVKPHVLAECIPTICNTEVEVMVLRLILCLTHPVLPDHGDPGMSFEDAPSLHDELVAVACQECSN